MSAPEQRFEVPPEYAEVYERAYRRAYEEGQGTLGSVLTESPRSVRGKRAAIPEQRGPRRAERTSGGSRARRPGAEEAAPISTRRSRRGGRRADHRAGSTLLPLLGLAGLMSLMLVGAFILGRVTATVQPGETGTGAGPGAAASATQGVSDDATGSTTYPGPTKLARVSAVDTDCTALPGTDSAGEPVSYDARNVVDGDPDTAWRCDGVAEGQEIVFTIAEPTPIVQVGIVPGFARSDPSTGADQYAAFNRITEVEWVLSDGVTVKQSLGDDAVDRSIRTLEVPRTVTGTVTLKILKVVEGAQDATTISTVELYTPKG